MDGTQQAQDEEKDEESAREHYKKQQELAQQLIIDILGVIDQKHVENVDMAKQLHKIHSDLTIAKEGQDIGQNQEEQAEIDQEI